MLDTSPLSPPTPDASPITLPTTAIPSPLILLRLTYFFFYLSLGSLLPYLPVYYHHLHLPGPTIGKLGAVNPFITFVMSPLWGALADYSNAHTSILLYNYIISVLLRCAMPLFKPRSPGASTTLLMLNVLVMSVFNAPVKALLDSTAMSLIPKGSYGRLRLYGQLGFGVGSSGMGILLAREGKDLGFNKAFVTHGLCSAPTIGIALYLRLASGSAARCGKATSASSDKAATSAAVPAPRFKQGMKMVLANPKFLLFFGLTFAIGLNSGVIENFSAIRMREVGGTGRDLSKSRFVSAAAGVPMFWHAGNLASYLGTPLVLTLTLAAYSLRFFIYSLSPSPLLMLPAEALRGCTFALFWSTITSFAYELSPPGMAATMLGFVNAMYGGLGQSLGALIGGAMQGRVGTQRMFYLCGGATGIFAAVVGGAFASQSVVGRFRDTAETADTADDGREQKI